MGKVVDIIDVLLKKPLICNKYDLKLFGSVPKRKPDTYTKTWVL